MSLTLVIGGTRSGKSAHAERLAAATGLPVRYVATADGSDPGMADRIAAHAARRPQDWTTVEAGAGTLADAVGDPDGVCVLIDGLGPWIATALHRAGVFDGVEGADAAGVAGALTDDLRRVCDAALGAGTLIVVAEQAGEGLLPPDAGSRLWLDVLGTATQVLAKVAARVDVVVAGRAMTIGGGTGPAASDPDLRHHGDTDVAPGEADHAVNVVAGGPPDWLRAALGDALAGDVSRYPSEAAAVAALAALHGRAPEEIVPANGAAEALWLLPLAITPRLAACVHPGFTEAEAALHAHGVPVARVMRDPERGFALDPSAVPEEADLVIAGNPASPSGTLSPAADVLALRRPGRVVVIDEAFMDFVPGAAGSLAGESLDDVIVIRSITKILSIPGLRAGYAIAAPAVAERLRAARPPWSANALALAALSAAAANPGALAEIAEQAAAQRTDLERRLAELPGIRTWPAAANFVLVEVADGPAAVAALRGEGIAVRPAASFPGLGQGHIRITARTPEENERLTAALAAATAASAGAAR